MLSKFIITVFVVIVAFFVLRQRKVKDRRGPVNQSATTTGEHSNDAARQDNSKVKVQTDEFSKDLRIGAYLFLVLTVSIGGAMYYFQWQDDHTVLKINLYRDNQVEPVSYEVFKYQLDEKSFVTVDGLSVAVASSERMEIIGLD